MPQLLCRLQEAHRAAEAERQRRNAAEVAELRKGMVFKVRYH